MDSERIKVIILGGEGAGKSSLLYTYITGDYKDQINPTIGVSFMCKQISLKNKAIRLDLWDTAGQEKYLTFGKLYWRDVKAVLLVYDVQDCSSIVLMKKWLDIMQAEVLDKNVCVFIAAAKIDLVEGEYSFPEEVLEIADAVGASVFKVSAKLNIGLDEVFGEIAKRAVYMPKNTGTKSTISLTSTLHSTFLTKKKKKNCC